MKVAFLTCHLPFPPVSGGRRREFELLKRLGEDFDVRLVVVSKTYDEDAANADQLAPYVSDVTLFPADPLPRRRWGRASHHVVRHRARDFDPSVLQSVELVHVEGFYLMQHVDTGVPVFLTEQNVEHQLFEQRGQRREARRTLRDARRAWQRASALGALTGEDRGAIRGLTGRPVEWVPDGLEIAEPTQVPPAEDTVLFVGNYAYPPNDEGARWLVHKVMPHVWRVRPRARLLLVGNHPEGVRDLAEGDRVLVCGRVPEVEPYYRLATVVVAPLRSGGGVKVKVLEALAHRKAIVSTGVGVQGLGSQARDALAVHDDPLRFAYKVCLALGVPEYRKAREQAAEVLALAQPSWSDAARALGEAWTRTASAIAGSA